MASREFVGYSDLTLMVPHAVSMILQEQKTSHLSTARWLRYHTILLDIPNITVKRCTTLNAATLLPTDEDGEEHHCCLTALEQVCTPHPDLSDVPLENCENVLLVDGAAFKDPQTGLNKVKAAQGKVAETPLHELKPGDFVVVRDLRRKSWKAKRWLGPFQVLLTTHMAVKVAERETWIQASHCREVQQKRSGDTHVNKARIQPKHQASLSAGRARLRLKNSTEVVCAQVKR
ncbi:uncharacterized protein LOC113077643 [Carassius auratus]|uniref:Uncharacterized protein LOC113077643 n=1 Tax=Carassius auratus TaxID=7957 RepID=A0A6P6N9K1_CARAU|nr:uncharacterized protein LOC113077643 [Carassius auratus]